MKIRKPWFNGDRTLKQQLKGLKHLHNYLNGARVLDLGCAEGHISKYCIENGASNVHGIDIAPDFIIEAKRHTIDYSAKVLFECKDLNDIHTINPFMNSYDVILALAILHKLRNPLNLLSIICKLNAELIIIRLPENNADIIIDPRSGNKPINVTDALSEMYKLRYVSSGHLNEWVGYYEIR